MEDKSDQKMLILYSPASYQAIINLKQNYVIIV